GHHSSLPAARYPEALVLPSRVPDAGRRWAWIFLAAAAVFIASAATVSLAGVPTFERGFYEALTTAVPNALVFRRITLLGSLRVHWPLDVVGGAAIGVAVIAAAAWWHERYPLEDIVPSAVPPTWRRWIYRWQNVLPFALLAVLFVTPPLAVAGTPFDGVLDVAGAVCMLTGLGLRLWAAGHRDEPRVFPARPPTRLVTTGPYALMRHPVPLANLLTGVGVALIAENGPALIVLPAALMAMYRITVPLDDAWLAERFGRAYI